MSRLAILHKQLQKAIGGSSVPMLSIKGNVFTVRDGENEQNVSAMDKENGNVIYVDVHIIDASPYKAKVFYEGKWDPDSDPVAPTCYSDDGDVPAENAQVKQADFCAQCPMNVWGSTTTDQGKKAKACRDAWKVAVVIPEFHPEKIFMLRIPGGSLANWLAYNAQFEDFPVDGRKMTADDVITRIYFEAGKIGIMMFQPVQLSEDHQKAFSRHAVENHMTDEFIGLHNMSDEKKQEMLALAAPEGAARIEHKPPQQNKPTLAKPKPVPQQAVVEEDEGEAEEAEEVQAVEQPVQTAPKARNAVLPSEMRTKATFKPQSTTTQAAPAATGFKKPAAPAAKVAPAAPGKATLNANVRAMLGNIMKMPTG